MPEAKDVMSVAESYIGTKENPANSNNVIFNTDYYGHPVSGSAYPWCCVFVWDCFRLADASQLFYDGGKTAYCPTYENWALTHGLAVEKSEGRYGDVATMDFGQGRASHIGFIKSKNADGTYQTIEGNTSAASNDNGGCVMERTRARSVIRYIFRPKYTDNNLKRGDTGKKVTLLQTSLNNLGYTLTPDGDFGAKTEQAVKEFQTNEELTVDGIVGPKTQERIAAIEKEIKLAKLKPDFTPEEFIKAVDGVYKMAYTKLFQYGDSKVLPPCDDHKISCDRLIFRALWNLGMTDQQKGGETVLTMDSWLTKHAFIVVTDQSQLRPGDIVLFKADGTTKPTAAWHTFVLTAYNPTNKTCDKYDEGSQGRIMSVQPFKNAKFDEWGDKTFYRAYRVSSGMAYTFSPSILKLNTTSGSAYLATEILKARGFKACIDQETKVQNDLQLNNKWTIGDMAAMCQYKTNRTVNRKNLAVGPYGGGEVGPDDWVDMLGGAIPFSAVELPTRQTKGTSVLLCQEILRSRNITDDSGKQLALDSQWGKSTEQAVKKYQTARKLSVTGVVDYETWRDMLGGI